MTKKFKWIACFIATGLLCIILIFASGNLLDPMYSNYSLDAIEAFHQLEDNTADVIIYGSSHAWKGCDPIVMYRNYGIAAYNYGNNWQSLNTTLLFLKDTFRTQHPKVVCIDTLKTDEIKYHCKMDGELYYTRAIKGIKDKISYLYQCFGTDLEGWVSYIFPIISFHDNFSSITAENFAESTVGKYIKSMGYEGTDHTVPVKYDDSPHNNQKDLPELSKKVYDDIIALCSENGAKVILYTCPYQGEFVYSDALKKYANENDCVYINLFEHLEDMEFNWDTDMQDGGHTNNSGAAKVADYLGRYIKENYDLCDMRFSKDDNPWKKNVSLNYQVTLHANDEREYLASLTVGERIELTLESMIIGIADFDLNSFNSANKDPGGLSWVNSEYNSNNTPIISNNLIYIPDSDDGWYSNTPCLSTSSDGQYRLYTNTGSREELLAEYKDLQITAALPQPMDVDLSDEQLQILIEMIKDMSKTNLDETIVFPEAVNVY